MTNPDGHVIQTESQPFVLVAVYICGIVDSPMFGIASIDNDAHDERQGNVVRAENNEDLKHNVPI